MKPDGRKPCQAILYNASGLIARGNRERDKRFLSRDTLGNSILWFTDTIRDRMQLVTVKTVKKIVTVKIFLLPN